MVNNSELHTENFEKQNEFPIDVIATTFKELIFDLNDTLNFPVDYSATAMIIAISTMIGTSVKVKVKNNWFEYASFYACLIGNAGANKTHPINTMFTPLKDVDKRNHDNYVVEYKKFIKYEKLSKGEKLKVTEIEEPILKKHVLTNFTPEALNKRLNENPRGCSVLSDEMATFFEGMNNYSNGDQISNYLTIWSNQPITSDRVGTPIPLLIKTPFLSVIGGLQPRMLSKVFPMQKLDNGFFQRFLFAYPESVVKKPINDNELNDVIIKRYAKFIEDYIENTNVAEINSCINSKILNWTPDAKAFFYQWQEENCSLVNEHLDNIKGEIVSKYDSHFIRLAIILQIMENPNSDNIEIRAVEGAKKLCLYYINCSFKVLEIIQNPANYLSTLPENKKSLYNSLNNEFTTSEAIAMGAKYVLPERRVKDFINDNILFSHIRHGYYAKKIKT
ncbi:MAG: DUF3987 domain-containing protein [Flavobacterium sp.]|nr:DUF3987 domain-containing protein [Flavobacterium sp.]